MNKKFLKTNVSINATGDFSGVQITILDLKITKNNFQLPQKSTGVDQNYIRLKSLIHNNDIKFISFNKYIL